MIKWAFYISLICSLSGILLIAPANPTLWGLYSAVLALHVFGGISLLLIMVFVTFTHVTKGLKHMSKVGNNQKSITGLWYFIVIVITTATGIFMGIYSGFAVAWVVPLHLVAGLWCFLLSLKHSLKKRRKFLSIRV